MDTSASIDLCSADAQLHSLQTPSLPQLSRIPVQIKALRIQLSKSRGWVLRSRGICNDSSCTSPPADICDENEPESGQANEIPCRGRGARCTWVSIYRRSMWTYSMQRKLFQFMEVSLPPFTQTISVSAPINIRQWNCILIRCEAPFFMELSIYLDGRYPMSRDTFNTCIQ